MLISLSTFAFIGNESARGLFQGGRKGDKEPRVSALLAFASALLLLGGYILATTTTAASVERVMFPVVAITVAGTYLFYTQLSLYVVRIMRKVRRFYWHKTNIITLSGLTYRWKDNGRMFFMVTIVSAVSFTSVGVFASIHTLSKELKLDYPAAVGYVAKGNEAGAVAEEDLNGIKAELERLNLPYRSLEIQIKYAEVQSQTGPDRTERLPLMAYSDYKQALQQAGFTSREQPLRGNEGLVMIGSQRDRSLTSERVHALYKLKQGVDIQEIGYTEHVPIAEYLLPELDGRDGGDFSGVVVSDSLFATINPVQRDLYTGFYVDPFQQTVGIASGLADKGKVSYESKSPYAVVVSGTLFEIQRTLYSTMLFASLLVGTVFFIAAGSFLYFRLYMDLDHDRLQYSTLSRMGLTDKELDRTVTLQLSLMFFVPVGLAILHSLFAFIALQRLFYLSIAAETGAVLIGYLTAQGLYFFLIRSRYLRNLKKISSERGGARNENMDYRFYGTVRLSGHFSDAGLENIFPPIPSEVILPFGGFMTTTSGMTIPGVLIASTAGSLLGALVLYWIGRMLDVNRLERIVDRWGGLLRISGKDIRKADLIVRQIRLLDGIVLPHDSAGTESDLHSCRNVGDEIRVIHAVYDDRDAGVECAAYSAGCCTGRILGGYWRVHGSLLKCRLRIDCCGSCCGWCALFPQTPVR